MKRIGASILLVLALTAGTVGADADTAPAPGQVVVTVAAEKEIEVAGPDGTTTVQRVPAEKVLPGDEVIYTITYTNNGETPAEQLIVNNPVPEHMQYVAGSASGDNSVITFSIDDGKTFDAPDKLTIRDAEGNIVPAQAADYTNVRWTIAGTVAPNASGTASFRARLE